MGYLKFIMLFIGVIITTAQTSKGTIEGIIQSANKEPLSNVEVYIDGKLKAISHTNGPFLFEQEAGEYTLELQQGHRTSTTSTVSVLPHKTTKISITFQEGMITLKEIKVLAEKELFKNTVQYALKKNKNIPGGNNLIDLQDQDLRRSFTLKDALRDQPGIIIQEFFGSNDQPRLNIRGSGIQSNPQRRGINLLQDDMPFNFSDGSYIIGLLEPQVGNYIEIFRGANSLEFGAANLGGALNIVSKTGYTTAPLHLKIEGGSYDLYNIQLEGGSVIGKTDIYASLIKNHSNGYRKHNKSSKESGNLNLGYKFNSHIQTRFYTQFINSSFDISGPLNKKMMKDDPTQISEGIQPKIPSIGPNVLRDLPRRDAKTWRIGNKTIFKINNDSYFNLDLYYQNADDTFYFPVVTGVRESLHEDYGLNLAFNSKYNSHHIKGGLNTSIGNIDRKYHANVKGEKGKTYADNLLEANNLILYVEDKYNLNSKISFIGALQLSMNHREIDENFSTPHSRPFFSYKTKTYEFFDSPAIVMDKNYLGLNPRIGILYEPNKRNQFYLNASKSYEPPTFDELLYNAGGNPNQGPNQISAKNLDEQTAYTIELGSRGENTFIAWDVSIYRSWVQDEILTTTDLFGISGETRNSVDTTIHQGLEMGLTCTIFTTPNQQSLLLSTVYNYSDFTFQEGIYKDKQIAGIPKHYLTGSLDYRMPQGLFANINFEYLPEDTPTDHQNTIYQDAYNLWGAKIGYHKLHWSVYAEVKNILDTNYASSYLIRDVVTNPPPPSISAEDVTTFIPGVGRNLTIGINYNL
ncbi:TonB-dependent receptor [Flavobacteriaceae bacterium Ap0902]|nr:TonB-dependent receptor [Flavobacteriaceae bacterium Ap0902]